MKERGIEVKVGALVLLCLVLFVGFLFILGDFSTAEGALIYADFPNSSNLKAGAPVKISGVTVGKVREVGFWGGKQDEKTGRRVQIRVTMEVEPDKVAALHEDADAYITTLGVLGEKYVEIDPGTFEAKAVEPGFVIQGTPPFQLEKIAKRLEDTLGNVNELIGENRELVHDILTNVNVTVKDADRVVLELRPRVTALIDKATETATKVDEVLATVQAGIGDGTDIRETIRAARATADNTRRITATVADVIKPVVGKVNKTLDSFNETASSFRSIGEDGKERVFAALDKVDGILVDTREITRRVKDGRGTIGAFMGDRELYDDIKEMVKDLKRHPWKFIWKE